MVNDLEFTEITNLAFEQGHGVPAPVTANREPKRPRHRKWDSIGKSHEKQHDPLGVTVAIRQM